VIRGAVLGSPISHSLSPILHKAAFDFLGVEGTYSAIDVPSGTLSDLINTRGNDFDYFSLTMPLKEEVMGLGFATDSKTLEIQSGNTVYRHDGEWKLTSTDGSGLISALSHAGLKSFNRILILGAGGTARAVTGALDAIATEIHVLGRSSIRQEALERSVHSAHFEYHRWTLDIDFSQYDLVVNTTPAGAADLLSDALSPGVQAVLFDVIYKPWPTELAKRWRDCGGKVLNGLELLLYQGIDQLEIVLDTKVDRSALANYLRTVLAKAAK
jgi:shikimate dehydrogenase